MWIHIAAGGTVNVSGATTLTCVRVEDIRRLADHVGTTAAAGVVVLVARRSAHKRSTFTSAATVVPGLQGATVVLVRAHTLASVGVLDLRGNAESRGTFTLAEFFVEALSRFTFSVPAALARPPGLRGECSRGQLSQLIVERLPVTEGVVVVCVRAGCGSDTLPVAGNILTRLTITMNFVRDDYLTFGIEVPYDVSPHVDPEVTH